ncbi:FAD-dependent monooxygenase [Bowmanella sp. Y26]|uniref:FAD-dependent monooxygenase n=1 Tax=Bowmanella yangjiangensis TaxID=2811230 RepID=UPI001BDD34CA|nr:FAD-dependent monooxygenase [Bowmanella yangjiangensis]MBT1065351.1 FAD-dependent monooxygenase [Bowmanella yangjiangensis]
MQKYDVVVVGGNMVGASVALGLAHQGYRVAIIEPAMPTPFDPEQAPDIRVSAISLASEQLLDRLGAWSFIKAMRHCCYRRLSVWEEQGRTDFSANELDCEHLGHIIENRIVQLGLHQALAAYPVSWFSAGLKGFQQTHEMTVAELDDGTRLQAELIIGADGAASQVRQLSGIATHGWQYAQQALAISIKTEQGTQDITWQRFRPSGPLAFLPLYDGYASLVWYDSAEQVKRLKSLTFNELKIEIQSNFPEQLVDFDILETASFPLTRMHANSYVQGRVVLLGDAAHTINPLAGQGVNLGFKDVACLLDLLADDTWRTDKSKLDKLLKQYQDKRYKDNLLMMSTMDVLYATFSNDLAPIKALRNLGLSVAQRAGLLKKQVTRYAMGL